MTAFPLLGPLSAERLGRVNRLRSRLGELEDRYGVEPDPDVGRLEHQLARRTSRIAVLSDQLDALLDEITRLDDERAGLLSAMELVLTDQLGRVTQARDEAWSPWPVFGFRLWGVTNQGLVGMFERWTAPLKQARCSNLSGNPDVPHTDPRCGEPRCGIYATRTPDMAMQGIPAGGGWAVGLVALSGKVVEHEHGYRAQRAEVRTIVVHHEGRVLAAEETRMVDLAFRATMATTALLGRPALEWPHERIAVTLRAAERRLTWTSDLNDG